MSSLEREFRKLDRQQSETRSLANRVGRAAAKVAVLAVVTAAAFTAGKATRNGEVEKLQRQGKVSSDGFRVRSDEAILTGSVLRGQSLKYKPGVISETMIDGNQQRFETKIKNPVMRFDGPTGRFYGYARICGTVVYPIESVFDQTGTTVTFTAPDGTAQPITSETSFILAEGLVDSGPISPSEAYSKETAADWHCNNPTGEPIGQILP